MGEADSIIANRSSRTLALTVAHTLMRAVSNNDSMSTPAASSGWFRFRKARMLHGITKSDGNRRLARSVLCSSL